MLLIPFHERWILTFGLDRHRKRFSALQYTIKPLVTDAQISMGGARTHLLWVLDLSLCVGGLVDNAVKALETRLDSSQRVRSAIIELFDVVGEAASV